MSLTIRRLHYLSLHTMSISLTFPKCTTDMSIVILRGGPEIKTFTEMLVFWIGALSSKIIWSKGSCGREQIDTQSTPWSTRDRHLIDMSSSVHRCISVGRQSVDYRLSMDEVSIDRDVEWVSTVCRAFVYRTRSRSRVLMDAGPQRP